MSFLRSSTVRFSLVAVAIGYLLLMFVSGAPPTHQNRITSSASGVLTQQPDQIVAVEITMRDSTDVYTLRRGYWFYASSQQPLLEVKASALRDAIKFMHTAEPVRVLAPEEVAAVDASKYGLEPAKFSVALVAADDTRLSVDFGDMANDGVLQYMRIAGRGEIYLMSGFVGAAWVALQ
ncbi:MAG: hypothetical protein ACI9BW_003614 [Gammaproteobacteria bacterium]|jgi:hypothetical protein